MKFTKYLYEEIKTKFKVGDKIRVKPHGADNYEPTANLEGVVININYYTDEDGNNQYEIGVSLNGLHEGHDLSYGTQGPVPFKSKNLPYGPGSGFYGYPRDFELIGSNSKYVRQLKFEAYELGQEPNYEKYNKYVVQVTNVKQSKELQNFLFKNGFKWFKTSSYYSSPIEIYKKELCISLNFEDKKDLGYSGKEFYESERGKKYSDSGIIYSLEEFFDMMEVDDRIKVKPSQIKEK